MSEQTRMSKYKDLRDNIDDDTYVPHEEDDADDDFLSFIPKSNHRESLEPKTYETLKYESNPFESLHEDHLNTTRTRTDTRLDILNQMKEDASSQDTICDYHTSELRRGHAVKGGSLMDKLAAMSPAAAGKSTIAKRVANNLGYTYIDTGAMYRCVAYYALVKGVDFHDENAVCRLLPEIKIKLMPDNTVYLNDRDVTADIRVNEISAGASIVSAYSKVRTYLVAQQREMAKEGGVILDGRDIGTVVLPNAELKIYQVASIECRALRRHNENLSRGLNSNLDEIKKEVAARDEADMTREISPLKKADDAIEIDTSDMTIDEVVAHIMNLVEKKTQ